MIRSAIELRGAHFLWVADLSKPDTLFMIPGIDFPFNLLPLLMVGVMVWQAHLQPASPGMDPSQQKMMRYMPLMFLLFLYNYSSGMALYMTVSTLLGIVQIETDENEPASGCAIRRRFTIDAAVKKEKITPDFCNFQFLCPRNRKKLWKKSCVARFSGDGRSAQTGRRHFARRENGGFRAAHWPPGTNARRFAIHHQPAAVPAGPSSPKAWWMWAAIARRRAKRL